MIDKYLLEDLSLRSDEKGELARWVIQLQADVDTERRKSASLESVIYARDTRIAELEAQLATPVRLSRRYETAGYCIDEHYCQEAADGDYLDRDELIASLREQGFTVEGDE
ncbi:TPA: hypothetical protein ACGD7M_001669 [Serratia marcescens]